MKESRIVDFVDKLGSKEPTPGGGAAAGVAASMGVGAVVMAMEFSNGSKLEKDEQDLLTNRINELNEIKEVFKDIIDRDATDFEPLSNAYGMARETDEEKAARTEAIQEGLVTASQPPIDLLNNAEKVIDIAEEVLPLIKKGIISDVGVGVQLIRAAILSSSLNVYINASSLKDEEKKNKYIKDTEQTLEEYVAKADQIFDKVNEVIGV
ncbi:MAG: cyclodeaminase/cyclohydrolase family protein [Atopococcus tabaci]|uniref:Cyclodeaminase/cyclohydrolase family protein n=1 Tax=Atopococcus tabaci TaxID=269774 RepID=A0AA43UCG8_9LACT|nr:cyclodeaminase/cyclohydrolase family protein [Atopococcus tabaci]